MGGEGEGGHAQVDLEGVEGGAGGHEGVQGRYPGLRAAAAVLERPETQPFQNIFPITDIATYRLNQLRGQCSENHVKCITRWKGRDGVTITIFFQHTRDGHETGYL